MRFPLLALALATQAVALFDGCGGYRCCQCTRRDLGDTYFTDCVAHQTGSGLNLFSDVTHDRGVYFCKFNVSEERIEQLCLGMGRCKVAFKLRGDIRGHHCRNCLGFSH
ncbi:hypothetical protein E4U42_003027 [Claviceps africana]|uniref:Secreted protein n=1 Tax=Claviceps africana TaxID=83212 RepID=A0A8K0J804_9HYPO|nr:hypothetical protein E4U42_003027 [Claviceps africana]